MAGVVLFFFACSDPIATPDAGAHDATSTRDAGGSSDAGTSDGGSSDAGGADAGRAPPDFASIPWTEVGFGVASKDSENPLGESVFIGYAGYGANDDHARGWVTGLYEADLRERGVRYVYAIRGPRTIEYTELEIENTALVASLLPRIGERTEFIAIAGHSSGSWVACEIFGQLFEQGYDPEGRTRGRAVYFNLDGAQSCVTDAFASELRHVYFVSSRSGGTTAYNHEYMRAGAERLASRSEFLEYDASASGCRAGARPCLHNSLISTRPHDPGGADLSDYSDFADRPVNAFYLVAGEAFLSP
jgi:hypothetical protein